MESGGLRTYVVRVWVASGDERRGGRVLIEEVRSGRQRELRGEAARALATDIASALGSTEERTGVPQEGTSR
jgi:hypothetical protein